MKTQPFISPTNFDYGQFLFARTGAIEIELSMSAIFITFTISFKSASNIQKFFNESTTDEAQQAKLFARSVGENFSNTTHSPSHFTFNHINVGIEVEDFLLDEYYVFDELCKIDTKKGIGPDGIHPLVLKNCSALIYKPLSIIFNESLRAGEFPNCWKRSSVTPIFKEGMKSNVENYRCIAKLPTIAKFFESLINTKL